MTTEANVSAEASAAEEWHQAQARAREAAEQERRRIDSLPEGSWVEIDVSNPYAAMAVKPCCPPGRDPDHETGSFGVYLHPSNHDEQRRPNSCGCAPA